MASIPKWMQQRQAAQQGLAAASPAAVAVDAVEEKRIKLDQLRKMRMVDEGRLEDMERGRFDAIDDGEDTASQDKMISSSNKGFQMLAKMGWKEDKGLGKTGQGRIEPIRAGNNAGEGLGKERVDTEFSVEATKERLTMEIETELTDEKRKEAEIAKANADIAEGMRREIKSDFYCATCDKQYQNVREMENHLSSYDHNHTKRLKELKRKEGSRGADDRKKKLKKAEDRETKKLASMAAAALAKANPGASSTGAPPLPTEPAPPLPDEPPPPEPPANTNTTPAPPPEPLSMSIGAFSLGGPVGKKKKKKKVIPMPL